MKILKALMVASAAFFVVPAQAQNIGTVTNHAFAIGAGAGQQGFTSALCTSAQLAVGQTAADPLCKTITGDVSLTAAGATTVHGITLGSDADGDVYMRNGGVLVRLPVGTNGQVLTINTGLPSWQPGSSAASVTSGSTTITGGTNGAFLNDSGGTLKTFVLTNYIGGLTLSNDGVTPNSVLDIAAGGAMDSTNAQFIQIGAFTKSTAGAWAVGSGSNGMGNGLTIAASTWYHVCLAYNGGTPDVWFDTLATCANKPVGVSGTLFRRIGSFKTDASLHILTFSQLGDEFLWSTMVQDIAGVTIGTTASLQTLTVPTSVKVTALINLSAVWGTGSAIANILVTSPDETDQSPSFTNQNLTGSSSTFTDAGICQIRTNTSGQIRLRSNVAGAQVEGATRGWIDRRGRDG